MLQEDLMSPREAGGDSEYEPRAKPLPHVTIL